jgi:membrane-bound lytic murein transglycosylase MltF
MFKFTAPISIFIFGGITYYLFFIMSGIPSIILGSLTLYKAIMETFMIIVGIFKAPEKYRIEKDKLFFKLRFKKERWFDIKEILEMQEKGWLDYVHGHSIIIKTISKNNNLYLNRSLINLKEFIEEIKRLNPQCKINGKYLESFLRNGK